MLYDPKWQVETKPDVLSIDGVAAWLKTKNPREYYNFSNCDGKCLYGQYMASHGIAWNESGAADARHGQDRRNFCILVYDEIARQTPWTFGAALDRAKAIVR